MSKKKKEKGKRGKEEEEIEKRKIVKVLDKTLRDIGCYAWEVTMNVTAYEALGVLSNNDHVYRLSGGTEDLRKVNG